MNNLNPKQQEAVDAIDGAVMVVAGPGTGKTQILAARIANMLQSPDHQINPVNILCLTYTDAGVVAMRQRLIEFMGTEAYKVNIHTFHSFCHNVVQWNLDYFGVRDVEAVTELESTQILYEIIDELPKDNPLTRLKGDVYYESTRLKDLFQRMKEEGWDFDFIVDKVMEYKVELPNREEYIYKRANAKKGIKVGDVKKVLIQAEEDKMSKLMAGAGLCSIYNEKLNQRKRYDYADMIGWVLKAFQDNEDFLLNFQEKYQYVLVDEFQDTNGSQSKLIDLLMSFWDDPNIFVVGDEDQSIYEFSGARVQNISDFQKKYNPRMILLADNYRSSQSILDASKSVIDNNVIRIAGSDKKLISYEEKVDLDAPPVVVTYATIMEEEMSVVESINAIIQDGTPASEIAVIYRKHRQGENIIKELMANGVPVNVKKRLDVIHEIPIRQLISMLMYVDIEAKCPHGGEAFLFEILHYDFWGNDLKHIEQMSTTIYEYRKDNYRWRSLVGDLECMKILEELIANYHNQSVAMILEQLLNKTGMVEKLLTSDQREQQMLIVNTFFSWVKSEIFKNPALNASGLIDLIDKMIKNDFPIPVQDVNFNEEGGVNFLTCHGAKGLEFQHVFMIGCTINEWEKSRGNVNKYKLPDTLTYSKVDDAMESNRRLFYVAMTRAKKHLRISYSKKNNDGKDLERTQFIDETENHMAQVTIRSIPDIADHLLSRMSETVFKPSLDKHIIDRALMDYRLSVSHLNKYLECPVAFYYENILRVPFVASEALIFGNAVHHALKSLYDIWKKEKELPSSDWFVMEFSGDMMKNRGQLTDLDLNRRTALGELILPQYYDKFVVGSSNIVVTEYKINNAVIAEVPVKGDIDKIEFNGHRGDIVDYKTGKVAYAKKELKVGGNYWRQGIFYALMLDAQTTNTWQMNSVRFEMIDEEYMGPLPLPITQGDVATVRNEIRSTYNSIINHEFTKGCGQEDCKWCNFQNNQ